MNNRTGRRGFDDRGESRTFRRNWAAGRTLILRWAAGAALGIGVGIIACLAGGVTLAATTGLDVWGNLRIWAPLIAMILVIAAFAGAVDLEKRLSLKEFGGKIRNPWPESLADDEIDRRRV
jgi:uncharacterized membrane protein YbhN (UPF0104 family)